MKILNRFLLGALCCAAGLAVRAENVSENAIGFVNIELTRGNTHIVGIPFKSFDGNARTVESLIGNALPVNTVVTYWDVAEQVYKSEQFVAGGFGSPDTWEPPAGESLKEFEMGEAFFVEIPSSAPNATYPLSITGAVPEPDVDTVSVVLSNGLTLVCVPFPVSVTLNDSNLALNPLVNEIVDAWIPGSGWDSNPFTAGGFGQPNSWEEPTQTLSPGQGFFYRGSSDRTWQPALADFYNSPSNN